MGNWFVHRKSKYNWFSFLFFFFFCHAQIYCGLELLIWPWKVKLVVLLIRPPGGIEARERSRPRFAVGSFSMWAEFALVWAKNLIRDINLDTLPSFHPNTLIPPNSTASSRRPPAASRGPDATTLLTHRRLAGLASRAERSRLPEREEKSLAKSMGVNFASCDYSNLYNKSFIECRRGTGVLFMTERWFTFIDIYTCSWCTL